MLTLLEEVPSVILLKYKLELVSTLSVLVRYIYFFPPVPGPVSTLFSLMSTTWAVISWSVPSYIPVDYPIITYEIGYTTHQSNGSCSPRDEFSPMIKTNTSSTNVTINNLIGNTCYLFGVHGYTVNGYGVWTIISNQTLDDPSLNTVTMESILVTPTTNQTLSASTTQSTVITNGGKIRLMKYGFTFIISQTNLNVNHIYISVVGISIGIITAIVLIILLIVVILIVVCVVR